MYVRPVDSNISDTYDVNIKKFPTKTNKNKFSIEVGKAALEAREEFDKTSRLSITKSNNNNDGNNNKVLQLSWDDLDIGMFLGEGGFSSVYDVKIKPCYLTTGTTNTDESQHSVISNIARQNQPVGESSCEGTPTSNNNSNNNKENNGDSSNNEGSNNQEIIRTVPSISEKTVPATTVDNSGNVIVNDEEYVLKCLNKDLTVDLKLFKTGAKDLVTEVQFLTSLGYHEHIIRLVGVMGGDITMSFVNGGYFLILEKLHKTLDKQLNEWKNELEYCNDKKKLSTELYHRLNISALGIAKGMDFIHSHNIIYRDLKPQNIGFCISSYTGKKTIRIFDFGLSRELPSSLLPINTTTNNSNNNNTNPYNASNNTPTTGSSDTNSSSTDMLSSFVGSLATGLEDMGKEISDIVEDLSGHKDNNNNNEEERKLSGMVGSQRYMAPEVASYKTYGLSADVYSYGIMLWYICSLRKPFLGMSNVQMVDKVVYGGQRPSLGKISLGLATFQNKQLVSMLEDCWNSIPNNRPTFKVIIKILNNEINYYNEIQNNKNATNNKKKGSNNTTANKIKNKLWFKGRGTARSIFGH